MIKNLKYKSFKLVFTLLSFIIIIFLCSFQTASQQTPSFILKDEPVSFTPKEFYFADITDERIDKSAFGKIVISNTVQSIDFQGGLQKAIKQYADRNVKHDNQLRPIIAGIKNFTLIEAALPGGMVEGKLVTKFSFSIKGRYLEQHLVDYGETLNYKRGSAQLNSVEPLLRQSLQDAFAYFNEWINTNADRNFKLAKDIKINFTDHQENDDDTIYYSVNRPLTWNDFKAKPNIAKFDAEIFPSLGYNQHLVVNKGIVNISLDMRVYIPKSACWVKTGSANDYTLNHEQRHFDIAKIVSERFKQKLRSLLTIENYEYTINMEYLEMLRDLTATQKKYDTETSHGSDHAAQANWNEQIDKELRSFNIKRS
jgi:hypothetical protein